MSRSADGVTRPIEALVELFDDLDEPDRIHVPDTARTRSQAVTRRVTGERDHVAYAQRVRAQEVRLERHGVPIARGEVDEGFETNALFDQGSEGDTVHAHARHRTVA